MLRKLHLYGELEEKYGREHSLDVESIGEAVRAMEANHPGFVKDINEDREYHLLRGDDLDSCDEIGETEINLNFAKDDFHIMPKAKGDKSGWFSAIIGAIIIISSIYFAPAGMGLWAFLGSGYGTAALFGASLIVSGVSVMMSPAPELDNHTYGDRENPEDRPSDIFNGPINTTQQGGPVPIVYGRHIVGSTVVSFGLEVEDAA